MEKQKTALKVGYYFSLIDCDDAKHIDLENTGIKVKLDNGIYELHRGATFEESQKIDRLMDNSIQHRIDDYRIDKSRGGLTR